MVDREAHLPPHDLAAEQSVLGAMLANDAAARTVPDNLGDKDFYLDRHRLIFQACCELVGQGKQVDVVTVTALLGSQGKLEAAGGAEHVHSIAEFVPAAANAPHYAGIVREQSVLRDLVHVGNEIAELGYKHRGEVPELVRRAKALAQTLSAREGRTTETVSAEAALFGCLDDIQRRRDGKIVGLLWPVELPSLAKTVGPIEPGSLTVVAARPSVGKTMLAQQLQRSWCQEGHRVLYVSRELTATRLIRRHLVSYGADMYRLRTGRINADDQRAIDTFQDDSRTWQVHYDETSRSVGDIAREVEILQPQIVIVDYLQRLAYDTRTEYAAITRIVNELQDIALGTGVPVVCLSQLSRPPKGQEHKRPRMSDTRGSGAVEERAATLILIHRNYRTELDERGYTQATEREESGLIVVAKCADGQADLTIPCLLEGARMRIVEKLT